MWPNSRIIPNFHQFKYPLFLSFYNSECSKKKGQKYSKFVPTFCSSNIPSPFSAVESNIGLLRKQAIGKSNETKKYYTTIWYWSVLAPSGLKKCVNLWKIATIRTYFALSVLKAWDKSTPPPVLAMLSNISYGHCKSGIINHKCFTTLHCSELKLKTS